MPPSNRILILGREPVVAALVGILVEGADKIPVYANPGETATEAIERLRPLAVVLVDATIDAAQSDLFFAVAARHGIRSVVFGAVTSARAIAEIAAARGIPWFTLPPTVDELSVALSAATGERGEARTGERRATADATVASDGTRILHDRAGRRWMIYDRRATGDRRAGSEERSATRIFVSDSGERRQCEISSTELEDGSASDLETQLERAT